MEELKTLFKPGSFERIEKLSNPKLNEIVMDAVKLLQPSDILVLDDSSVWLDEIRKASLAAGEERELTMTGHSIHYDGYADQGRDKENTAILLPPGTVLSRGTNVKDREKGLAEVRGLMSGIMKGKTMIICFFCLGPKLSEFSLCALQITDSYYVTHSELMLYRTGYEQFMQLTKKDDFFSFYHSSGVLDEKMHTTKDISKRRIYMDVLDGRVYTVNNQYAGNSLACKKLALRLAIYRSNITEHGAWLTEHMFISAFTPPKGGRKTYFAGAYPSACGKTSTAMIPGASIVGDDILYLRRGKRGEFCAVNIEQGIFGIIEDVNAVDDPEIFKALTTPREIIFSNVLSTRTGRVFWTGCGFDKEMPAEGGINHSGEWAKGKTDPKTTKAIPMSHPNSRFTLRLSELPNVDTMLHNPQGVEIGAILYGGRDSDTSVPVAEALSWEHGVFIGASIESETTTATLGAVGVRESNPMANLDFLSVPLGTYISNHIKFGRSCSIVPRVYATNYFLKNTVGKYLNAKTDKKVWVLWAEGRVHHEYDAIHTPVGFLPRYEDLKALFDVVFKKDYTREDYEAQFAIRVDKYLEKFTRVQAVFEKEPNMPKEFTDELARNIAEMKVLKEKSGKSVISPFDLHP